MQKPALVLLSLDWNTLEYYLYLSYINDVILIELEGKIILSRY